MIFQGHLYKHFRDQAYLPKLAEPPPDFSIRFLDLFKGIDERKEILQCESYPVFMPFVNCTSVRDLFIKKANTWAQGYQLRHYYEALPVYAEVFNQVNISLKNIARNNPKLLKNCKIIASMGFCGDIKITIARILHSKDPYILNVVHKDIRIMLKNKEWGDSPHHPSKKVYSEEKTNCKYKVEVTRPRKMQKKKSDRIDMRLNGMMIRIEVHEGIFSKYPLDQSTKDFAQIVNTVTILGNYYLFQVQKLDDLSQNAKFLKFQECYMVAAHFLEGLCLSGNANWKLIIDSFSHFDRVSLMKIMLEYFRDYEKLTRNLPQYFWERLMGAKRGQNPQKEAIKHYQHEFLRIISENKC